MSDAEGVLSRLAEASSVGDQVEILRSAWGSAGLVELSVDEADGVLARLAAATNREAQLRVLEHCCDERRAVCAFDVAIGPLVMAQPQHREISKLVDRAITRSSDLRYVA